MGSKIWKGNYFIKDVKYCSDKQTVLIYIKMSYKPGMVDQSPITRTEPGLMNNLKPHKT